MVTKCIPETTSGHVDDDLRVCSLWRSMPIADAAKTVTKAVGALLVSFDDGQLGGRTPQTRPASWRVVLIQWRPKSGNNCGHRTAVTIEGISLQLQPQNVSTERRDWPRFGTRGTATRRRRRVSEFQIISLYGRLEAVALVLPP